MKRLLPALLACCLLPAARAGTFASDTFTGSDSTTLDLHVGELGAAWTKCSDYSGSAVIEGNALRSDSASSVVYRASTPSLQPLYIVEADFVVKSLDSGKQAWICQMLGMKGADGMRVGYNIASGKWEMQFNNSGGGWAVGGGGSYEWAATLTVGVTYHVKVEIATGSPFWAISTTIDGTKRIDTLISKPANTAGTIGVAFDGLMTSTTGIHLDNFTASNADSAPSFATSYAFALAGESNNADSGVERETTVLQLLCEPTRANTDRTWNFAIAAQTVAAMITNGPAKAGTRYALTTGFAKRIAVLGPGSIGNDLVADGLTAAQARTRMETWVADRHAEGWLTLVSTLQKAKAWTDAGVDTVRADFNAALVADHAFSDYFIDAAALSIFSDVTNTTYYQADQNHWKLAARTALADAMFGVLKPRGTNTRSPINGRVKAPRN